MIEVLQVLLISVLGSSIVLGLFVFFLKKYIEKFISYEFDKRGKIYEKAIEHERKILDYLTDGQLGIFPEITELVYRIRNIIRDGVSYSHAYEWNDNLKSYCAHLTENLYKYRLFLPGNIFNALHEYKKLSQDIMMRIDVYTREEKVLSDSDYQKALPVLLEESKKIDDLHNIIVSQVSSYMYESREK